MIAKKPRNYGRSLGPLLLTLLLAGCSGSNQSDDAAGEPRGSATSAGATAGRSSSGRSGANGGTAGGGSPATTGSGGTAASAGRDGGGGTTSGGATAAGGTGAATGGAATTGGTLGGGAGGVPATGGRATGGATTTGGRANGGASTGGRGGSAGTSAMGGAGGVMPGLPAGVSAMFPAPGGTNVCKDPQLRVTFPAPPTLGNSGTIQVLDASGTAVASVNMASATVTDTLGGQSFTLERRAYVDGNTAVIYLPSKGLAYGQSYSVNVPAGAIVPNGGGSFSISGNTAWRFSTAGAAPASLANVTVALDGSGAFCSLQGAFDALPSGGSAASTLSVASGNYHEVVYFKNKSNVTVHGESRTGTVILGTNNNDLNPSTKGRALVGSDGSQNLVLENLTIENLTPQGGSQAEALRLESCTHCAVHDADIESLQDTLLWSGTLYAKNCYIAGNVDFIWGTGAAYFDQCEIKTVGRSGYVVQSRNATSGYGYVFVDSKITADAGITGSVLARIDVSAYPGSHVAYVNCALGSHITRAGWLVTGGSPGSSLRFWEYQSTDLDGNPLDVSGRLAGSQQISSDEAATMRDPSKVLGGWQPN